jgi:hypothetical protein
VTLVAADRDRDSKDPTYREQIDAYEQLMATYGIDYTRVRSGYRTYDTMDGLFDGEVHRDQLPGLRELDWETFSGHAKSLSVTPQPGHSNFEGWERESRRYFDTYARDGVLTVPTICWISAAGKCNIANETV